MGDSYGDPQKGYSYNNSREGTRPGFRGGRGQNNRDQGGFRIRLSDNEMNAARRLQEAFNLRSTVAVLGFSLRTLGQMLEDGQLDELVNQYRSQGANRDINQTGSKNVNGRNNSSNFSKNEKLKANPFERPAKPISSEILDNSSEIESTDQTLAANSDDLESNDLTDEANNEIEEKDISNEG